MKLRYMTSHDTDYFTMTCLYQEVTFFPFCFNSLLILFCLFSICSAVIQKVKARSVPPFRPVVQDLLDGAEGLRDVMKKCWSENPEERPHFSELKKDVEVMMKANGL